MERERIAPQYGWRHTVRLLKLEVDPFTAFAFDCLEDRGLGFGVHFGTQNAIEMAAEEWLTRLDERKA